MSMGLAWAIATALAAGAPVQDGKYPPFEAGRSDVTFGPSAPHGNARELKSRFRFKEKAPAYDVKNEKFRIWIPASYKHADPWGLFIYISAGNGPSIPGSYLPLFEKRKILAVSAHRSGNSRNIIDRFRLAIDADFNMRKRFNIDPKRVYLSGFSGGARTASMLAVAYSEVFSGAIPLCGVNFYKNIPGESGRYWPLGYLPTKQAIRTAKAGGRYVLMTGENDANRENTEAVYKYGFRRHNYKHALYLEVPGMKHAPPPADWMDKGLEFLDSPK